MFALPRRRAGLPDGSGSGGRGVDWAAEPEPLVAFYLRRPDAKPRLTRRDRDLEPVMPAR